MKVVYKKPAGVLELFPEWRIDSRGFLVRLYDREVFRNLGLPADWVQESRVHTNERFTLRGLHVSLPPSVEGKAVTAVRGELLWVAVDLRKESGTFGRWVSTVLSGMSRNILCVERGFAHGCLALTDDSDLLVKADNYFSEQHSAGIVWNDPDLNIDWGLGGAVPIISERDAQYPSFREFKEKYGGL